MSNMMWILWTIGCAVGLAVAVPFMIAEVDKECRK